LELREFFDISRYLGGKFRAEGGMVDGVSQPESFGMFDWPRSLRVMYEHEQIAAEAGGMFGFEPRDAFGTAIRLVRRHPPISFGEYHHDHVARGYASEAFAKRGAAACCEVFHHLGPQSNLKHCVPRRLPVGNQIFRGR
jgi:hypothetical protein